MQSQQHAAHAPPSPSPIPESFRQSAFHIRYTNTSGARDPSVLPYMAGLDGVSLKFNQYLIKYLWASIIAVVVVVLACRIGQLWWAHLRRISSMSVDGTRQRYWSVDKNPAWPVVKRDLIYAPLGKKRHNREIRLSTAANYGTVPGRLHTLLLMLYAVSNAVYCILLDYANSNRAELIAEARGRTGILAAVNMIPLVVLAGRNNPAIPLLKVSFDTFNLFHRWIGRIVIVETVAHVVAWGANADVALGLGSAVASIRGDLFLSVGLAATVAMLVMLVQSLSPIRHAFYETFLHLHQALAFTAAAGVYVHVDVAHLPARPYLRAVVVLWLCDRTMRLARLLYLNLSRRNGCTWIEVAALPGEACRVTFHLPRHVTIRPGSHVYAYFPRVSWWMSHPFSVAWTNVESEPPTGLDLEPVDGAEPRSPDSMEKPVSGRGAWPPSDAPTSISLVVVARTGMTRQLYDRAMRSTFGVIRLSGFVEGPYAGHDSLASYGTVLLFAGGAGITHHLIQIRHLVACAQARTVATRRVVLAWSVRDVEMLAWVRPWMDEILRMEGRREVLKMVLFVTQPRRPSEIVSPSPRVQLVVGRCQPGAMVDQELPTRVGAMVVSVCGPGAFADDVRAAVRQRLDRGCIDLVEEAFTW